MLDGCKDITYTNTTVKIMSALGEESTAQLDALAEELTKEYAAQNGETANKIDQKEIEAQRQRFVEQHAK